MVLRRQNSSLGDRYGCVVVVVWEFQASGKVFWRGDWTEPTSRCSGEDGSVLHLPATPRGGFPAGPQGSQAPSLGSDGSESHCGSQTGDQTKSDRVKSWGNLLLDSVSESVSWCGEKQRTFPEPGSSRQRGEASPKQPVHLGCVSWPL